jgi:hypothetical protein
MFTPTRQKLVLAGNLRRIFNVYFEAAPAGWKKINPQFRFSNEGPSAGQPVAALGEIITQL